VSTDVTGAPRVLLATFALMPGGEPGGDGLLAALAEHGVRARWAVWDDPSVDWSDADLVAVRSTWDYHRRCPEFLAWARAVEQRAPLLNGAGVLAWNADKSYLLELAAHVPAVPTALLDDAALVEGLASATDRWGTVVVKPRTGAGGAGVVLVDSVEDPRLGGLTAGPWIVQPLVGSVRSTGETSVFVFSGAARTQVDKVAAGEEVRVHESYGGSSRAAALDPERAVLAEEAVRAAAGLLDADLPCARVDLMHRPDGDPTHGGWAVSEVELIEPSLYLDLLPANADHFARAVSARLRPAARG
jgi:glutathione synthase/RimK-type ligase-like ATP-grasp enzyme